MGSLTLSFSCLTYCLQSQELCGRRGPLWTPGILRGWLCGQTSLACEVLPSHRWTVISDRSCGRLGSVWVRLEGGASSLGMGISPQRPVSLGCGPCQPGPASQAAPGGLMGQTLHLDTNKWSGSWCLSLNWKFVLVYPGLGGEGVIPRSASKRGWEDAQLPFLSCQHDDEDMGASLH